MTMRFTAALAFGMIAIGCTGIGSLAVSTPASAACGGVAVGRPASSAPVGHTIGKAVAGVTHAASASCGNPAQTASVPTTKTTQHPLIARTAASNTKAVRSAARAHAVVLPHSHKA